MRKKNAAYLRVSTEAQTEKYGLDVQRQKIMEYCDRVGIFIDKWYVDGGYSGSKLDRPEMQRLLSDSERGEIGKIFVYKLDRLSRNTVDTLNLLNETFPKHGIQLISMTEEIRMENPMDEVVNTVNAAMNQYERKVIRMRMSAGMKERVKKGLWMGGGRVPIGYYYDRNDGILHIDEEQAEKVREAYRMYIDGYSCESIAHILGISTDQTVHGILKRKTNIGLIEYNKEVYKGMHEPIIDEETFYKAQECMEKRHTNSHVANDHILTGLCYCGVCGARMRYQKWGKYHKILCYSQQKTKEYMIKDKNCNNQKVFADKVEQEVERRFKKFAIDVEKGEKRESRAKAIESEVKKLNAKIKKLYDLYSENESEPVWELIQENNEKVKELKKQLKIEIEKEHKVDPEKIDRIKSVADIWDTLTNEKKNAVLKECINKVVITGDKVDVFFLSF